MNDNKIQKRPLEDGSSSKKKKKKKKMTPSKPITVTKEQQTVKKLLKEEADEGGRVSKTKKMKGHQILITKFHALQKQLEQATKTKQELQNSHKSDKTDKLKVIVRLNFLRIFLMSCYYLYQLCIHASKSSRKIFLFLRPEKLFKLFICMKTSL
jgi:hypothetical protein